MKWRKRNEFTANCVYMDVRSRLGCIAVFMASVSDLDSYERYRIIHTESLVQRAILGAHDWLNRVPHPIDGHL